MTNNKRIRLFVIKLFAIHHYIWMNYPVFIHCITFGTDITSQSAMPMLANLAIEGFLKCASSKLGMNIIHAKI